MPRHAISLSAVAVLAASGCIVVAKSETQDVNVVLEDSTSFGELLGWEITTRIAADKANIVVTTTRVQTCTRLRSEVYDELETTHTSLLLAEDDPASLVCMIVLAVPFLPVTVVTAIIAESIVAGHHDTKTHKTRSLDATRGTCPVVGANVPVELTLPSGSVLRAATDSDGRAVFAIPAAEPDSGTAITRVADQTRSAAFFRTTEACTEDRDEIFSRVRAAAAVEQRLQLLRSLPTACGDAHERMWSLAATAALEAVASRCESIKTFAAQARAIDRDLYATLFSSEPDIAKCLDDHAVTGKHRATCIELQRAEMSSAEQIDDVLERTRILTSLPDCGAPLEPKPIRVLAGDAAAAARAGDCATMKKIAAELRAREGGTIHDAGFLNDEAIQGCYFGHPPAPTSNPPSFCTTSPNLPALCFCSRVEAECEARQHSITAMGATMSNCASSSKDRCLPGSAPP